MTTVDTLQLVVEHAKRWGIGEKIKQFHASGVRVALAVPDKNLHLFMQWARHLDGLTITGVLPGSLGYLHARGRLLSGLMIDVTVEMDGIDMRALHLYGAIVLGEVEQAARKAAAA